MSENSNNSFTNNNDKLRSKDTRWDRIRKRHMNSLNVKTETVKKFFAIDYIAENQMQILSEDERNRKILDPVLVMNLRHEMIHRTTTKRKNGKITGKEFSLENTRAHNKSVEEHYIENELSKFKNELEKSRRKNTFRPKLCLNLNNEAIFKSLANCNGHTIDFYKTVQGALGDGNENRDLELNRKDEIQNEKSVRFEDSVEVINYSREESSSSSNTSSDVESVVSDFVENVVNEIRIETQMEMIGKALQNPIEDIPKETYLQKPGEIIVPPLSKEAPLIIRKISSQPPVKLQGKDQSDDEPSTSSKSTGTESKEQDAIISELFTSSKLHDRNIKLLRKFFLRWTHFTTIAKIEKLNLNNKNDRFQKINTFLDKVRQEKRLGPKNLSTNLIKTETKENSVVLAKKYQNKIKIQQDIIDLQRIKLERQERMIMELKINKLSDEAKQAREEVKQELKIVIKTGEIKHRTKAKCLQLVGNMREEEDEDEFSRLQGKALLMPKFLANMQERALERSVKHEQAKQRRLQMEAEREAAKIAYEEAKRQEDEDAKRKRIEALKEKRRLEKLAKVIKEREHLRCIENNKKCQEFRRRRLLRSIGMEGFKRLIKRKRKFQKTAETHRKIVVKKKIMKAWKIYVQAVCERKIRIAEDLYVKIAKRVVFKAWRTYTLDEKSKYLVAVDWYELKITESIFQQWLGQMKMAKLIEDTKMMQALSHYNWNMRWKVLDHWRRLPQVLQIEKETEERRQRWRMKIWELLPDYKPTRDE